MQTPVVARAACLWDRKASVMSAPEPNPSPAAVFFAGVKSALTSVFFLVLMGTYVGVGALAHDYGFSSWWLALSSMLVWAAPGQVILISSLGTGAAPVEGAIAVGLSAIRLFPMVVALLPLLRGPSTRLRNLLLPTHFTSVSMWVESLRLLPSMPRERRIAFCNGLSVAYMGTAVTFGFVGYYLAAGLPPLFAGTLLFLTPMSFLISTANNCRQMVDRLALVLGLVLGPLLVAEHVQLDLMWTGVVGGSLAYGVHRLRQAAA
jgi:predicted branched-subunit amino acid permease